MDNPLIYNFKTVNGNNYIYNANTNYTYPINKVDLAVIKQFKNKGLNDKKNSLTEKYRSTEIQESFDKISEWVKYEPNFFNEKLNGTLDRMPSENRYYQQLANIDLFTLELTQQCNLRCKYCVYGGNYKYVRRHQSKKMSWTVAKRGIEYFLCDIVNSSHRTKDDNSVVLSFYGGEPLLEFEHLKKCVEYSKQLFNVDNKRIKFGMTTNGTLLNEKIIKYLINNKINLFVSLDGPKEEHDKHRIYKNGKGSFEKIYKNLKLIYKLDENYYKKEVRFLSVYTPYTNLKNVIAFFSKKNPLFLKKISRINMASSDNTKYYDELPKSQITNLRNQMVSLEKSYLESKSNNLTVNLPPGLAFADGLIRYKKRYNNQEVIFRAASCVPGLQRLFADVNGVIHACEKINGNFPLGDVWTGISYKKVKAVYEHFLKNICTKCQTCIAFHICGCCLATFCTNTFEDVKQCENERRNFEQNIINYFSILEKNPLAIEE